MKLVIIDLKIINTKQNINKKFSPIENTSTNLIKVQKRTGVKEKFYACYKINNEMQMCIFIRLNILALNQDGHILYTEITPHLVLIHSDSAPQFGQKATFWQKLCNEQKISE